MRTNNHGNGGSGFAVGRHLISVVASMTDAASVAKTQTANGPHLRPIANAVACTSLSTSSQYPGRVRRSVRPCRAVSTKLGSHCIVLDHTSARRLWRLSPVSTFAYQRVVVTFFCLRVDHLAKRRAPVHTPQEQIRHPGTPDFVSPGGQ